MKQSEMGAVLMIYTMQQAVKATGKSKATLHRAIKSGKFSASKNDDGHYEIDPAEIHRVYPKRDETSRDTDHETKRDGCETGEIALNMRALEKERDAAEKLAEERAKTIDDLRSRLDAESEERRKLTAMLTDQRPKGFWARLRGR